MIVAIIYFMKNASSKIGIRHNWGNQVMIKN